MVLLATFMMMMQSNGNVRTNENGREKENARWKRARTQSAIHRTLHSKGLHHMERVARNWSRTYQNDTISSLMNPLKPSRNVSRPISVRVFHYTVSLIHRPSEGCLVYPSAIQLIPGATIGRVSSRQGATQIPHKKTISSKRIP